MFGVKIILVVVQWELFSVAAVIPPAVVPGTLCCIYVNSNPNISMNDDKCGGNIGLFNYPD